MKKLVILFFVLFSYQTQAQTKYSEKIAKTIMHLWPDSFASAGKPARWSYDMGVYLKGMEGVWMSTANPLYFNYIQKQMDVFIKDDGSINGYRPDEYNIDHINNGKLALLLYKVTQKEKYLKAAKLLRSQIETHPRTKEGGFWHKKIYPNQMWLDGLYMGQPFYAEYSQLANDTAAFNDIANQFIWMEQHARDTKTGLLYHAWDESKSIKWANPETGCAPNFWARAMGWYATAIVDALDWFPKNHPKRQALINILNRLTIALEKQQDKSTGLWYDVMNYNGPGKEKNYFESSAASQFVFAIAKGVRLKYLPEQKIAIAKKGFDGLIQKFVEEKDGYTNFNGTVTVSGLGGNPFRDGSFEYYMSEKVITNDPKGIGAFLLACNEMEMQPTQYLGKGKSIVMDNYFNSETKIDAFGNKIVTHYKWWEKDNGGFSFVNHICNKYGVVPTSLDDAPTAENLKNVSVYFLIDPDWPKENKTPNYIEPKHIEALVNFVKKGGTLVLMANDTNNVEFKNYNKLAEKFGIHWNENLRHDVIDNNFAQGATDLSKAKTVFPSGANAYIKQLCTQTIKAPAKVLYSEAGEVLMSTSTLGKGRVFAVGDPWFYNEYVDGRKLPALYNNYSAADDLIKWLLKK